MAWLMVNVNRTGAETGRQLPRQPSLVFQVSRLVPGPTIPLFARGIAMKLRLPLCGLAVASLSVLLATPARADEPTKKTEEKRTKPKESSEAEVKRLLKQLDSPLFSEREKALNRLVEMGKVAVPTLREALNDVKAEGRPRLESILAAIDNQPNVAKLVAQLGAPDFAQRERAARQLTLLGRRALPALQKAANSPDQEISLRARRIIEQINKQGK
jgi:HEAT repeat protein